jgi:hypothetical protein
LLPVESRTPNLLQLHFFDSGMEAPVNIWCFIMDGLDSFRRPRTPEVKGISWSVWYVLAVTLISKLISCSNHSAFCDAKHYWFLFASIHLFKINYKHEV